jgi:hypothetical protein
VPRWDRFAVAGIIAMALVGPFVGFITAAGAAPPPTATVPSSPRSATGPATNPGPISGADVALARIMLSDPRRGFGPGTDFGPLNAGLYARYAPDPTHARATFDHDSAESGFAGDVRTWQDASGHNQIRELALRFHAGHEATATTIAYEGVLSGRSTGAGGTAGNRFIVPGISAARGYLLTVTGSDDRTITDELQVVLIQVREYVVLIETDVQPGNGNPHPIPSGTVTTLAERQYPAIPGALAVTSPASPGAAHSLSTTWLALAAVIGVVAVAGVFAVGVNRTRPSHRRGAHPGR